MGVNGGMWETMGLQWGVSEGQWWAMRGNGGMWGMMGSNGVAMRGNGWQ